MNTTVTQEKAMVTQNPKEIAGQEVTFTMPTTEDFATLNTMDAKFSLQTKYRTQEEWMEFKDKPIKCFFQGWKEIPNEDAEMVSCGIFAAEDGVFISGQMMLIDAIKKIAPGTPIQITYEGKKPNKNSKGSTNLFDVQILG